MHRTQVVVDAIVRVDHGPREDQRCLGSEMTPTHTAGTTENAIGVAQAEARLSDLLADVSSREDSLVVATQAGRARLVASGWFTSLLDLAELVLVLNEPVAQSVDAATVVSEGHYVSELRDDDTGAWQVKTATGESLLVNLGRRSLSTFRDDEDKYSVQDGHSPWQWSASPLPILRLVACRVGTILTLTSQTTGAEPAAVINSFGRVTAIMRLEAWAFA